VAHKLNLKNGTRFGWRKPKTALLEFWCEISLTLTNYAELDISNLNVKFKPQKDECLSSNLAL